MADPFVAEIRIFPFNFAPKGWATCDGQLMPISQNTALFSLLGTNYGGDGKSTFALPNLQGSAPLSSGQGPGLTNRDIGETGGTPSVALLEAEMPSHSHSLVASNDSAQTNDPTGNLASRPFGRGNVLYAVASTPVAPLNQRAVGPNGGSQPHNNMQPFLTLNYCIALQGVFPARQ
ncbi:MAG: phage tail protein [Thermoanaerobaculia bacterium]